MKIVSLISTCLVFSIALTAQQQKKDDQLFDNWFAQQPVQGPQRSTPPPPPNVPLDGGLIALIAAGGALGYKEIKKRREE